MSPHIAIIGAGIVGVSTAVWLQRAGYDVTLIERETAPGEAASFGNGGVLASSAIVPVSVPGLLAKAPKMLLSRHEPLFLKWPYLPRLTPWMLRFLRHANAPDTARIAAGIAGLIGQSLYDHQALAEGTGAERFLVPGDYLYVYDNRAAFAAEHYEWSLRRAHGFDWDELEGMDFRTYDPVFSPGLGFAIRLREHGRISDPGAYVKALAAHVVAQGGRFLQGEVSGVVRENGRVTGLRMGGETLPCDAMVLAAGAWSGGLAGQLGVRVPLETERGYHLELIEPSFMPRAPVMISSGKFVVTPLQGRLRLAGIVEFGGLKAGPSRAPLELLRHGLRTALPRLTWKAEQSWMGHRPTLADSLPVIGAVPGAPGAYMAFGHHHIGLTGGAKTGRLLAQLIAGQAPELSLDVYSPARFMR